MFRKLLTIEEAKTTIQQHFKPEPIGTEHIPLLQATGRILAENVVALLNIPPFDRSTVDGYAVKSEDTFGAEENRPVALNLCGRVSVGEFPTILLKKGVVSEIVTGAPLLPGADAVVMMEHTIHRGDIVLIY